MTSDERIERLEQRVATLEEQLIQQPPVAGTEEGTFWALEGLRARIPEPGGVMMVGSVQTPNGVEARWQLAAVTQELFNSDFADRAETLFALAHPVRLRIIQRLLTDAATVQDLSTTAEFGTSGQIYHHLKQLVATGWLRTAGRGRYEVPAARIVPLLVMMLGAEP